jgi:DNA-binding transcriptional LysR family regulator
VTSESFSLSRDPARSAAPRGLFRQAIPPSAGVCARLSRRSVTRSSQRTADGLVLTEEGHGIIALAEQMEEGALAMERRLAGQEQNLKGSLRISSADWFRGLCSASHPGGLLEGLPPCRRRDPDRHAPVQPRPAGGRPRFPYRAVQHRRCGPAATLFRLEYGVYIAEESHDPRYGDGTGFRLITHETSTGHFPDIAWLIETFPNARPVLRSNNRNVQGRMCRQGVGIAVLPRVVGTQIPGIRRLDLPTQPPARDIWVGYHRDLRRLRRLRAFVSTVSDHLGNATV